jgi:hypothetical protein
VRRPDDAAVVFVGASIRSLPHPFVIAQGAVMPQLIKGEWVKGDIAASEIRDGAF